MGGSHGVREQLRPARSEPLDSWAAPAYSPTAHSPFPLLSCTQSTYTAAYPSSSYHPKKHGPREKEKKTLHSSGLLGFLSENKSMDPVHIEKLHLLNNFWWARAVHRPIQPTAASGIIKYATTNPSPLLAALHYLRLLPPTLCLLLREHHQQRSGAPGGEEA